MINKGSLVLAGVSGGPDSVTMLDILERLKKEMGFDLKVIHVNHGIRGQEALRDQKTVEKLCEEKKISCSVYSYNVPELSVRWKMGHEEAGRKVRREAFEKERLNAGKHIKAQYCRKGKDNHQDHIYKNSFFPAPSPDIHSVG